MVKNRSNTCGAKRGQGECYQWKAKGQCLKGDNGNKVKSRHKRPLLLESREEMVKHLREERVPEVGVHLVVQIVTRAESMSMVSARNHRVIFGILPDVRVTRSNRDADSVINVLSCTGS